MRAPHESGSPQAREPEQSRSSPVRTGDDQRRRGWFWHWNTIITQFAPLIGLKGVGLLNSYTVWTDQRADSPYRGYAFPSQQAEAAFYGEDRAELITINKLLVALDLIEIRKEMVTRVDEAGRRWRVPHNFYRVKDRGEGFTLTIDAVIRVLELAATDEAVYRYIRHIFSPRFAPIDRDNVWHRLLPALRTHPLWQQLAARAAADEARTSARTKAGHHRRRNGTTRTAAGDPPALPAPDQDRHDSLIDGQAQPSSVDQCNNASETVVAQYNSAASTTVAPYNHGLPLTQPPIVASANSEEATIVAPENRTYEQYPVTTTRSKGVTNYDQKATALDGLGGKLDEAVGMESSAHKVFTAWDGQAEETTVEPALSSRLVESVASQDDHDASNGEPAVSFDAVVACYEAANGRAATPLERELLAELVESFSPAALAIGESGERWVIAAIREAVSSGSAFVAPKRIREILNRWSARRSSPIRPGAASSVGGRGRGATDRGRRQQASGWTPAMAEHEQTPAWPEGAAPGQHFAADELAARLSAALSAALGTPLRVTLGQADDPAAEDDVRARASPAPPVTPTPAIFADRAPDPPPRVPEGLTLPQLWAMALEVLRDRLSPLQFDVLIRPAALIGIESDGTLVLGAPNQVLCRRLQQQAVKVVQAVLEELLGRPVALRVVVAQEWRERRAGH